VTISAELPPSLENLVARIDRRWDGPRWPAQLAAAIGRTFPVSVLARVRVEATGEALTALLRAEIVREVSRYPELECTFTHGLVREAALSTLTSTRKRALYAEIAAAFEVIYAESLTSASAARPLPRAGGACKALEYAERRELSLASASHQSSAFHVKLPAPLRTTPDVALYANRTVIW
jgi:hypothetical protein